MTGVLGRAMYAVAALSVAGAVTTAHADDPTQTQQRYATEQELSAWETRQAAGKYSENNAAIGIYINYGRNVTEDVAEQYGDRIEGFFARHGIMSKAFTTDSNGTGMIVAYYLKGTGFGDYNLDTAKKGAITVGRSYMQEYPERFSEGSSGTANTRRKKHYE